MPNVLFLQRVGYEDQDFAKDSIHDLDKKTIAALGSSVVRVEEEYPAPAEPEAEVSQSVEEAPEPEVDPEPEPEAKTDPEPETKDALAPENKMVGKAPVKK